MRLTRGPSESAAAGLRIAHRHRLPDPRQFQALRSLGFTPVDVARMNVVELYDRIVRALRTYKPEIARPLADQLFGPGAWKEFDFLSKPK